MKTKTKGTKKTFTAPAPPTGYSQVSANQAGGKKGKSK